MKQDFYFKIDERILKFTNLNKILYPKAHFSKKDVIRYYKEIGETALPHLENRPFTLKRFPQGVDAAAFFEKQCPHHRPSWIRTEQFEGVRYCLVNDLASLLWIANLAALELHTTLARIENLQCPTFVVFDLDPGEGADFRQCAEIALLLRKRLKGLGLECFPKTSGMKGLHVYVPLNTATTYEETKPFSHEIALDLEREHPDLVTSKMPKKFRVGKVFIDWSQNTDFKTTTTVYSLRASEIPSVSTPLRWREVLAASKQDSKAGQLIRFGPEEVLSRIREFGDLFEPVLKMEQQIRGRSERPRLKAA